MTTLWADGFEDTAAADLAVDYTIVGSPLITTGRRAGTSALRCNSSGSVRRSIGGTASTVFQSLAINYQALPNASFGRYFMRFMESAAEHISLFATAAGEIAVYRGNFDVLLGTSGAVFTPGMWKWVQVKVVIHDSTGSVEIRDASGGVILALTGIDTRNAGTGYCDAVGVGSESGTGVDAYFDDWHTWDTAGTICNTWTNDTRIDSLLPGGAGAATQFTPSAGANYDCVNEANYNTTDYVDSSTAGHQDLYAFGDLAHTPTNIYSVLATAVAQKDDAGARSIKMLTRSGGVTYAGSAKTLDLGSYKRHAEILETNPNTAAAWTKTGVNGAEFGIENV